MMGSLYRPNMVSDSFAALLKKHGLRKIRFHDIRHSCASLLWKNGVNLKLIQEWLGHSDISTTMNIYAHLDTTTKDVSAAAMSQAPACRTGAMGTGGREIENAHFLYNPFPLIKTFNSSAPSRAKNSCA